MLLLILAFSDDLIFRHCKEADFLLVFFLVPNLLQLLVVVVDDDDDADAAVMVQEPCAEVVQHQGEVL